jgi:hypothetical protein
MEAGDLSCLDGRFVLVITKKGAWEMFAFALLMAGSAMIIVAVFYEVPKRCYGQFAKGDASFIDL